MESSLVFWIAAAVTLFWAVGAYNRLVRLRSEAKASFSALDAELAKQVQLVHTCIPPEEDQQQSSFGGGSVFWGGLQGAASQLAASLAAARSKPLDPERIAALGAAQDVLGMAWERAERDDAHDLAGPRLPGDLSSERAHMVSVAKQATENFNVAVGTYNDAIRQFPAILLAWLFGFHAARGLRVRA